MLGLASASLAKLMPSPGPPVVATFATLSPLTPPPMPLLQAYGPAALTAGLSPGQRRQLAVWLGACSAWVFVLVVVGGITRLTRSGLSMTSWKFTGERPPSTPVSGARGGFTKHVQSSLARAGCSGPPGHGGPGGQGAPAALPPRTHNPPPSPTLCLCQHWSVACGMAGRRLRG